MYVWLCLHTCLHLCSVLVLYRAVLSDGPQQDLVLDTSGDYVVVHYSECSTSSEEEVEESENDKVGSCTVLCAPLSDEDKEDWDAV